MRNQSSLGSVVKESNKSRNMSGMLFYGKVTKVYPKYHSADVVLYNNQYGKIVSSASNKGKYACRILEPLAGYDSQLKSAFGTIHPVQVGSTVVVGFLSNYSSQPVILGCIYPSDKGSIISEDDYYKKMTVTRLKDYSVVNSSGEFEIASNTGAMVSGSLDEIDEEFDLKDGQMSNRYPYNPDKKVMNIGVVMRTAIGRFKLIFNSLRGIISIINKIGNKSAFIRMNELGDLELGVSNNGTTSIKISSNNEVSVTQNSSNTKVSISPNGSINISAVGSVSIDSKSGAVIRSSGNISVSGSHISLSSSENSISF